MVPKSFFRNGKKKTTTMKTFKGKGVDKVQSEAINKLQHQVKRLTTGTELKHYTLNTGVLNASTTPQWFFGFSKDIVQGSDDVNRIGDQVRAHSIHIKGNISLGNPPLSTSQSVRVILVRYKASYQLSSPQVSDLLFTSDYRSFYRSETKRDEYTILYDKTHVLTVDRPLSNIRIHKRLGMGRMQWNSGPVLNGPTTGHLFMLYISDQASGPYPIIDVTSMLYFKEE